MPEEIFRRRKTDVDGYNEAADEFLDDLTTRSARHKREEQVAYATVQQLQEVKVDLREVKTSVMSLQSTIEGSVTGARRNPGLVDVVGEVTTKLNSVSRIGIGIGVTLGLDLCLTILRNLHVIK